MPLFMNHYLLAMLNNMALMIGSSEIDEEYELVLKEDVIRYCSEYIRFIPEELSLRSNYNLDAIGRSYEFLNYLIAEMRFSHQRSRYIFSKFIRLRQRCSYDRLIRKLIRDKRRFLQIIEQNEH